MQTVREQLAEALEEIASMSDKTILAHGSPEYRSGHIAGAHTAFLQAADVATTALSRHRAECAVETCTPACDQPTEAHCVECPCYQAGLEAQREPAGRGTA